MFEREHRVPDWFVERLVAGDLPPGKLAEVRTELAATEGLARIEELRAANGATLARYPAKAVAVEIERRLAERARREGTSNGFRATPKRQGDRVVEEDAQTLWEHLAELRSRIVRTTFAFVCGTAVAWLYRQDLLEWLTEPYVAAWQLGGHASEPSLHFPSPASAFLAYVRVAGLGGFVLALPFMLYQGWSFVAPGLYSRERRLAGPFVVTSCGLFAVGAWFGWRFAFPQAFDYLLSFSGAVGTLTVTPTVMVSDYLDFTTRMLVAFGVAAELPVLVFFLALAGLVTHVHLIRFFRYFVVLAFVLAAVLTPPDPLSQFLLAVPLCLLYGLSIGLAFLCSKRRA